MEQTGEKWDNLPLRLGGANCTSSSFVLLSLPLIPPFPPWVSVLRVRRPVSPPSGPASQMLPWGKQKHLSPAQAWLSLSDKSWGGLCQCRPACHLHPPPPFYTMALAAHTHTHFTLFALVRLHPDSVTEAGGSHPFCPLAFYASVFRWHI